MAGTLPEDVCIEGSLVKELCSQGAMLPRAFDGWGRGSVLPGETSESLRSRLGKL